MEGQGPDKQENRSSARTVSLFFFFFSGWGGLFAWLVG